MTSEGWQQTGTPCTFAAVPMMQQGGVQAYAPHPVVPNVQDAAAMDATYYVQGVDGIATGPFPLPALVACAAMRKIAPNDMLSQDGNQWYPAADVSAPSWTRRWDVC